jgi:competence protein ComEC
MRRVFKIVIVVLVVFVLLGVVGAVMGPVKTAGQSNTDKPVIPTTPSSTTNTTSGNMTVDYIDVGQGDSELIVTPDNKTILIDTGPSSAQSAEILFIRSHTWGTIDDLVLTHPDEDHIGNAAAIMHSFTIRAIYYSGYVDTTDTYNNFMTSSSQEGCPVYTNAQVHAGDLMNWSSSTTIKVMAINAKAPDPNDSSIVLRMTYGTISYLFMGDASSTVEAQMVATFGTGMEAQILKVGHHGSSSATSDRFLTDVDPKIGVIEVGAGNTYGHPTNATLRELTLHDVQVFRTDLNGTVEISTNGTSYAVSVQKHTSGDVTPPATAITVPDTPTNVKATAGDGNATISWTAPINNGGAAITGYGIYKDGVKDTTTTGTSITLSGLTDGVTYQIGVTAINSAGESISSTTVPVIPVAVTPTPTPTTNIVINEVESNPAGTDAGNEWVELYNPSDSSVDLSGWSVKALHGVGDTFPIPSGASIAAHGYYVITFKAQFLDNTGEVVVLYNASHTEIDRTPALDDAGNDGNTWQRVPNGTDTGGQADWQFKTETKGSQN